jgi:hypothetical protein
MKTAMDSERAKLNRGSDSVERLVRKIDLRTREGRRAEILDYVRTHGGFSIFWITENHLRAVEGTAMVDRKEIKVRNRRFPWSDVIILPNDQGQLRRENVHE